MVPTKAMARAYSVLMRFPDAIIFEDRKVHIVEAKLRPNAGACGQLEHYKELFYRTPEFKDFYSFPLEMILLTTYLDLDIVEFCSKKGILYEVHTVPGLAAPPDTENKA